MRRLAPVLLALILGLAALRIAEGKAARPSASASAKASAASAPDATRYVVVLKAKLGEAGVQQAVKAARVKAAGRLSAAAGGRTILTASVSSFFGHAFGPGRDGFAADLSEPVVQELRRDPRVLSVEKVKRIRKLGAQSSPPWGLDRVDQRFNDPDGVYYYNQTGCGVHVYVVDTGINADHVELQGKVERFWDFESTPHTGGYAGDCDGHGTHVAGIIVSAAYGAAKRARVYSVRVLDCNGYGSNEGFFGGIDYVVANHAKPAIMSMSLGGEYDEPTNLAVQAATEAGIVVVVAAGNEYTDACLSSPASAPTAIAVGATGPGDARADYSNWGPCVSIFAPGSDIRSTYFDAGAPSNTSTALLSGTSMATPLVSAVAALYLETNPGADWAQTKRALLAAATDGVVLPDLFGGPGTPAALLYSRFNASAPQGGCAYGGCGQCVNGACNAWGSCVCSAGWRGPACDESRTLSVWAPLPGAMWAAGAPASVAWESAGGGAAGSHVVRVEGGGVSRDSAPVSVDAAGCGAAARLSLASLPLRLNGSTSGGTFLSTPNVTAFALSVPAPRLVSFAACGPGTRYDATLALYDRCPPAASAGGHDKDYNFADPAPLAFDDDGCGTVGGPPLLSAVTLLPGRTYYLVVSGFFGSSGSYALTVAEGPASAGLLRGPPPALVPCASAPAASPVLGDTSRGHNLVPGTFASPELLYTIRVDSPQEVTFDTCAGATDFDTVLALYESSPFEDATAVPVASNDDGCGLSRGSLLTAALRPGVTYHLVVEGWVGVYTDPSGYYSADVNLGAFGLSVTNASCPPAPADRCASLPVADGCGAPVRGSVPAYSFGVVNGLAYQLDVTLNADYDFNSVSLLRVPAAPFQREVTVSGCGAPAGSQRLWLLLLEGCPLGPGAAPVVRARDLATACNPGSRVTLSVAAGVSLVLAVEAPCLTYTCRAASFALNVTSSPPFCSAGDSLAATLPHALPHPVPLPVTISVPYPLPISFAVSVPYPLPISFAISVPYPLPLALPIPLPVSYAYPLPIPLTVSNAYPLPIPLTVSNAYPSPSPSPSPTRTPPLPLCEPHAVPVAYPLPVPDTYPLSLPFSLSPFSSPQGEPEGPAASPTPTPFAGGASPSPTPAASDPGGNATLDASPSPSPPPPAPEPTTAPSAEPGPSPTEEPSPSPAPEGPSPSPTPMPSELAGPTAPPTPSPSPTPGPVVVAFVLATPAEGAGAFNGSRFEGALAERLALRAERVAVLAINASAPAGRQRRALAAAASLSSSALLRVTTRFSPPMSAGAGQPSTAAVLEALAGPAGEGGAPGPFSIPGYTVLSVTVLQGLVPVLAATGSPTPAPAPLAVDVAPPPTVPAADDGATPGVLRSEAAAGAGTEPRAVAGAVAGEPSRRF
eukprot:tig00001098_g7055.t1